MGLLYQFPDNTDDQDHVIKKTDYLCLRTYGLPSIFWLYGLVIIIALVMLIIAIKDPLTKLLSYHDDIFNLLIGYGLIAVLIASFISLIAFFFYEKRLIIFKNKLLIKHYLFFICFNQKTILYNKNCELTIGHFIDSPNMAKINDDEALKNFYNKGYFELFLKDNSKMSFIDRSSRKADLVKLKTIIEANLK